ncbi:hypothetical protein [Candidatus Deianiraea vastatrix]|uniref:VirB6-like type IV secretion system n=1 Tax=Candidatus Deianiraea vastatrix TaxID=2163644 RepID=A0A5B8XC54_9RICK|nr:hypothetical protein [Candidatus Deianiraea vastatrix]QED22922.1 Putative VirB6-like type IV secretion system [Candidatus Deianiraea vastatrix]
MADGKAKKKQDDQKKKQDGMIKKIFLAIAKHLGGFLLLTVIVFTALMIFAMSDGKNMGKCYNAAEFGAVKEFTLDVSEIKGSGATASVYQLDQSGQNPDWIDSGLETTGDMIVLYSNGLWFPWGKNATSKRPNIVKAVDGTYAVVTEYAVCNMSDDLNTNPYYCNYGYDQETGKCRYLEYSSFALDTLHRYYLTSCENTVPLNYQNSYIGDYHFSQQMSEIYSTCLNYDGIRTQLAQPIDRYTTCALANGYGVYMKLGLNAPIAYHVANKTVPVLEPNPKSQTGYSVVTNSDGIRMTMAMPFTIPTTVYNLEAAKTRSVDYQVSAASGWLAATDGSKEDLQEHPMSYYGDCKNASLAPTDSSNAHANMCEFAFPQAGLRIYFTVADLDYTDNEGKVTLRFARGARYAGSSSEGMLNSVWNMVTVYALGLKTKTIDIKDSNGNIIKSEVRTVFSDDGLVVNMRNAILRSPVFQATILMFGLWSFMALAFDFLTGKYALSVQMIVSKAMSVGFVFWFSNPNNSEIFDYFLIPLFLTGTQELSAEIISGLMQVTGFSAGNIDAKTPFVSLDSAVRDLFGPSMLAKSLGFFSEGGLYILISVLIFWSILSTAIYLVRISMIFIFSTIGISVYFALFPFAVIFLMYSEKFQKRFEDHLSNMITMSLTSVMGILIFTIVLNIVMSAIHDVLSYEACFKPWFSIVVFTFYKWEIVGNIDSGVIFKQVIAMITTVFLGTQTFDFIQKFTASIFGGSSALKDGSKIFGNMWDFAAKPISKMTGVDVSSKALDNPGGMLGSMIARSSSIVGKAPKYVARKGYEYAGKKLEQLGNAALRKMKELFGDKNKSGGGGGAGGGGGGDMLIKRNKPEMAMNFDLDGGQQQGDKDAPVLSFDGENQEDKPEMAINFDGDQNKEDEQPPVQLNFDGEAMGDAADHSGNLEGNGEKDEKEVSNLDKALDLKKRIRNLEGKIDKEKGDGNDEVNEIDRKNLTELNTQLEKQVQELTDKERLQLKEHELKEENRELKKENEKLKDENEKLAIENEALKKTKESIEKDEKMSEEEKKAAQEMIDKKIAENEKKIEENKQKIADNEERILAINAELKVIQNEIQMIQEREDLQNRYDPIIDFKFDDIPKDENSSGLILKFDDKDESREKDDNEKEKNNDFKEVADDVVINTIQEKDYAVDEEKDKDDVQPLPTELQVQEVGDASKALSTELEVASVGGTENLVMGGGGDKDDKKQEVVEQITKLENKSKMHTKKLQKIDQKYKQWEKSIGGNVEKFNETLKTISEMTDVNTQIAAINDFNNKCGKKIIDLLSQDATGVKVALDTQFTFNAMMQQNIELQAQKQEMQIKKCDNELKKLKKQL